MTEPAVNAPMPIALPYRTAPAPPSADHQIRAAKILIAAGVAVAIVGGCFLVGVLAICSGQQAAFAPTPKVAPTTLTSSECFLLAILYLLAFTCFGSAATLLWKGVRILLGVAKG
jgi:hypothetical protein